jgi:hypothetical protein
MARTKQTSRKSMGRVAPRMHLSRALPPLGNLPLVQPTAKAVSSANSKPILSANPITQAHDNYCYICVNGGDVTECETCSRVMCSDHFNLPADADVGGAQFICIACHLATCSNQSVPYFVSAFISCNIYLGLNMDIRAFIQLILILKSQWPNGPPFLKTLFGLKGPTN